MYRPRIVEDDNNVHYVLYILEAGGILTPIIPSSPYASQVD